LSEIRGGSLQCLCEKKKKNEKLQIVHLYLHQYLATARSKGMKIVPLATYC